VLIIQWVDVLSVLQNSHSKSVAAKIVFLNGLWLPSADKKKAPVGGLGLFGSSSILFDWVELIRQL
jgi:hypothetical protein